LVFLSFQLDSARNIGFILAGLYQVDQQFLYVNRGFGYLGFPGRVGIYPEITEFTLKRSKAQ
jgi:predicted MPP superfamily phosphohydrolase